MTVPEQLVGKTVLGRYRVVRSLARGGQGAIYLARNEGAAGFVKPVVVKRILPQYVGDAQMEAMITREARILSSLRHPGIVNILDFAKEDGAYVMVLDYVHGYHFGRWYRFVRDTRGPFPVELALHVVLQVLEALEYAHTLTGPEGKALGIVHRDVTPANVLLDVEGHVKLADFGIARTTLEATDVGLSEGQIKGNFPYVAPELFGGAEPHPCIDVYSCGVLLHEILKGENEIKSISVKETVYRAMSHDLSPLVDVRDDVSAALSDVIARAASKDRLARPQSASQLAAELRALRQWSPEQSVTELRRQVARDFGDPRFAAQFQAPPLAELDAAWRSLETVTDPGPTPPAKRDSTRPTALATDEDLRRHRAELPTMDAVPAAGTSRTPWIVAAGVAIAAIGVVATVLMTRPPQGDDSGDPPFILVTPYAEDAGASAAAPPPDAGAAGTVAEASPPPDAGEPPPGDRRPPDRPTGDRPPSVDVLTRRFAQQQGRVAACFREHAESITGTPRISIRFRIDTAGRVESADVSPAAVGQSALGTCIAAVARSTQFGPQPEPTSFHIPIMARRAN